MQAPVKPPLPKPLQAICKLCQGSRAAAFRLSATWQPTAALALLLCISGKLGSAQHIQLSSGTAVLLITTLLGTFASLAAC